MIRLQVLSGEVEGRVIESREHEIRLGRASTNHLVVPDWHVSAEHATVFFAGDGYVARDQQSTNGTSVRRNGKVILLSELPERELRLMSGDELWLGDKEHPVRLSVVMREDAEETQIVSVRSVEEMNRIVAQAESDGELLRGLYEAQKAISAALDTDAVLRAVADQVFRFVSRATHVTGMLRELDDTGRVKPTSPYVAVGTRVRDGENTAPIPITRSVFKKVVAERSAVLAADAKQEVGETASLMAAQILSTIGVPLWHGDEIFGVLQVDNRGASGMFRERDLDVIALMAQTTSQAFRHARLIQRLRASEEQQRIENTYLKKRERQHRRFEGLLGESTPMKHLFDQLRKVVDTRVTVLIEGETGTGKELVASAVHYWSDRRDRLFVAQNCAALPENLLESELFGHKRGAFTGATDEKKGLFELADGGTLFLDEIGEMPLSLQPKLLRALQEGEIRPVGANNTKRVDVRIVAATNRDLEAEVKNGRFREDLFYRLRVFPIRVPPLRERREDVMLLANHFMERYCNEFGRRTAGFSQQAMEVLNAYAWPGNVRELENEVQRLVIQLEDGAFVMPQHLSERMRRVESVVSQIQPTKGTLKEMMDQVEKWVLLEALRENNNNKSATARVLGITREGLHKKLKSHGIG